MKTLCKTTFLILVAILLYGCTIYRAGHHITDWEGRHVHKLISTMGHPSVVRSYNVGEQILTYQFNHGGTKYHLPHTRFHTFWVDKFGYIYRWRVE